MSFLSPGFLWLLALAAPVVFLYFFRQRQEDRVVPTNFLWVQAVQDTRTAAILRKFLKSLLLLLQLIFLALSVLALAGATASLWSRGSARLVVAVLDRSASMGVADAGEGRTRMEAARGALENAVEGLRDDDRMMLIAVDERAEVLVPFTGEKERLRRAAALVEVRDLPTDLAEAVLLLRSQVAGAAGRDLEVILLSDGAFPDPGAVDGARVSFVPFGEEAENAGITDLNVVRGPGAAPALFVSVEAFGEAPLARTVSLRDAVTGSLLDARDAEAGPGGQAVILFPLEAVESRPDEPASLEVRLEGEDPFPADDVARVVYRPEPPRRYALYGKESRWLKDLAALRPGLEGPAASVTDPAALRAMGDLDLVIYNGEVPDDPPPCRAAIYIGCVPPGGPVEAAGMLEYPPVVDWSRTHPITRHAAFSEIVVVKSLRLEGVPAGGVLVDSVGGPLLALVEQGTGEALYIPFDLDASNFPIRLAYPLVMANTLDYFFSTRRAGDREEILRTGRPLERRVPPGGSLFVTPPGRPEEEVAAGPEGRALFRDTATAGLYRLRLPGGRDVAAASLLRRGESAIAPQETVEAGGVVHEARPEAVRANILLRDPLLLLALAILTLEWFLWIRRR